MNSNKTVDGNSVHENMMVDLDYHEIDLHLLDARKLRGYVCVCGGGGGWRHQCLPVEGTSISRPSEVVPYLAGAHE